MAKKILATKTQRNTKKNTFVQISALVPLWQKNSHHRSALPLGLPRKTQKHKETLKNKYINSNMIKEFKKIPENIERYGKLIVDSAYTVHKNLGPGLLEKVYEICFCHELSKRRLNYQRQIDIPIVYDNLTFDEGLRLDVLVENCIICELKALETVNPVWEAQILSHLKLTGNRLGYLINFNVPNIKEGIRRFVV